MKKRIKLKGRIKSNIQFGIYLGILLCIMDVAVFTIDIRAGIILTGYLVCYFAVTLSLYFRTLVRDMIVSITFNICYLTPC